MNSYALKEWIKKKKKKRPGNYYVQLIIGDGSTIQKFLNLE